MGKFRRKPCDGTRCHDPAFFKSSSKSANSFFQTTAGDNAPSVQKEDAPEAPKKEEVRKDPMVEGLKTAGEQLFKHEPFKLWFKTKCQPMLGTLKAEFWDNTSGGEKALLLSFAGINLGTAILAFSQSRELRKTLSGANVGALLGLIPYFPIDRLKSQVPGAGRTAAEYSADFTLNPYFEALQKLWGGFPLTGATFGLESTYDPARKKFELTGGKTGLDFFGGRLKAEGKTFIELSPYPPLPMGRDGMPPSWLMQEVTGMPDMKTGMGYQLMLNADIMKIRSWLTEHRK